jgi:hypothetical protein
MVDSDGDDEDDNEVNIMVGPAVKAAVALGDNSIICSKVAVGADLWTKEGGVLLLRRGEVVEVNPEMLSCSIAIVSFLLLLLLLLLGCILLGIIIVL